MNWKLSIWLACLCSCAPITSFSETPVAVHGQLDVTSWGFEQNLPLSGEWAFQWKELIQPKPPLLEERSNDKNLSKVPPSPNAFQVIGERWKNKYEGTGYATYQLKIRFPITAKENVFALRFFQTGGAAMSIYVDGHLQLELGKVGKNKEMMVPTRSSGIVVLPHPNQETNILVHISNFHHDDGAFWYPPTIGLFNNINKQILNEIIKDSLLTGALLFMAFYHFVVFLFRRNRSIILYFGLYCLMIALHSISLNGDSLYYLFPEVPYRFAFILSLIFYLTMPFYLSFLYQRFPENFSKWITNFFIFTCSGLFLFALVTPSDLGSQSTFLGLFFSILGLLYSIVCVAQAAFQKKEMAQPLLLIQVFLFLCAINDTLYLYGILKYFLILEYSYLSTVLFQSLLLASYFTKSVIKTEVLGKELTKLNESLEKTVILRTQEYKEAKQIAEEANEWKDKFISLVAHDLRSPLSTVYSALTIVTDKDSTEEEKTHIFKQLFVILENAMSTVEHLLNLNRFNKGKIHLNLSQFRLLEVLQPLADSFSLELQKKSLRLDLSIADTATIYADKTILIEILRNVIANAIKFSNPNGWIRVGYCDNTNSTEITIEDNGQGIPFERQKDLFYKQMTSPGSFGEKGFGIGLKLCFELTRLHQGNIRVQSEEGKGSLFTLEFPKEN
ncbi:sensor histidine kinase [Leptospira vanthielii]|uniref:histidine kinase n=1 Tax=Leptospira vanthielii serovar Holland str. Waz Holland = ATCC 700522 TaxID=1218591 RepID=N1WDV9_9LEPT|nr:sensor histidine kinase [Leptospira vanthielii]EMY71545.1 GHKL domain protein [Leptospira vanthielii serovar Holland str. Waz Holland = ATCC 700522]